MGSSAALVGSWCKVLHVYSGETCLHFRSERCLPSPSSTGLIYGNKSRLPPYKSPLIFHAWFPCLIWLIQLVQQTYVTPIDQFSTPAATNMRVTYFIFLYFLHSLLHPIFDIPQQLSNIQNGKSSRKLTTSSRNFVVHRDVRNRSLYIRHSFRFISP